MRSLDLEEGVVVALSSVFAVLGLTFACVGIWCIADSSTLLGYANAFYFNSQGVSLFGLQPGFTLVPCGLLGVFPLIVALVATCKPSKTFLIVYIVYLCVLVLLELPMTIVMLASWTSTRSTLKTSMEASMKDDYVGLPYSYTHNKPNSLLYDKLMLNNQCCGINSNADFTSNYNAYAAVWYAGYRSHTLGNGTGYTTTIPSACCMYSQVSTMINNNDWLNYRNYLTNQLCPVSQANSYAVGCFETVAQYSYNVIAATMGCYIVVILLHVAAIVAAGLVYHSAHRVGEQPDWQQYQNGGPGNKRQRQRQGRRGRQQEQQEQQEPSGKRRNGGRLGNNPNSYGAGWGANSVYGRA